jgi:hypothetical protein
LLTCNSQWDCLCFSDAFLEYFEECAARDCTKLEYPGKCANPDRFHLLIPEGAYCEVAKSCSALHAPLTIGPYSTAVTIDDPRTYPKFSYYTPTSYQETQTAGVAYGVRSAGESVARTMTTFMPKSLVTSTVTLEPEQPNGEPQGPSDSGVPSPASSVSSLDASAFSAILNSVLSSLHITESTGSDSSSAAIPSVSEVTDPDSVHVSTGEPPLPPSASGDRTTEVAASEPVRTSTGERPLPPPASDTPHLNETASPVVSVDTTMTSSAATNNETAPASLTNGIVAPSLNATSWVNTTGTFASNTSSATAPTVSKSPHTATENETLSSITPAPTPSVNHTGLCTEPEETTSLSSSSSHVHKTETALPAPDTTTTTAGAAFVGESLYAVGLGALVVLGVLALGL